MTSDDKKTKAKRCATLAVANIETLDLTASPRTFTVFFQYALGEPAGLVNELRDAFDHPERITDAYCHTLYDTHFGGWNDAANLTKAVSGLLETLGQAVSQQDRNTTERTGELQRLQTTLGEDPGPEQLSSALLQLNDQVSQAIAENNALKEGLNQANEQIQELDQRVETVTKSSMTDALTKIGNRAAFDKRARDAVAMKARANIASTLILLDIDHFKSVNDTYGHPIGDEVLKAIASGIANACRETDFVARYGGEEFAAILPGTTLIEGRRLAERLREVVATLDLGERVNAAGLDRITASFGVAEVDSDFDPIQWTELTDKALYRAKANGRNRVVTASELTEIKTLEEMTVLIVEDDPTSAKLLDHMIRKMGVKDVLIANNGLEGLDTLANNAVDCVICDGVMPEVDGLEFTIRVRTGAAQSTANMPIMLLTARQEESWANAARDAGANEFLNKPVSLERLDGAMRSMLFEPSKFIKSRGYVGPDRRTFQDPNYAGPERRSL